MAPCTNNQMVCGPLHRTRKTSCKELLPCWWMVKYNPFGICGGTFIEHEERFRAGMEAQLKAGAIRSR